MLQHFETETDATRHVLIPSFGISPIAAHSAACMVESAEKILCGGNTDLLYSRAPLEHPRGLWRAQLERKASVGVGRQFLKRTGETMSIAMREGGGWQAAQDKIMNKS